MPNIVDDIAIHLPYYLLAEDRNILLRNLSAVSRGETASYILSEYHDEYKNQILQGDVWSGFRIRKFDSGEQVSVHGIILSNSCDINPEISRVVTPRLVFAPLTKMSTFRRMLQFIGLTDDQIEHRISSIRNQTTTSTYFLPAENRMDEDVIANLDNLHSMPVEALAKSGTGKKICTLSNTGFYMLLLKLSVHFCRMQEAINRGDSTTSSYSAKQ